MIAKRYAALARSFRRAPRGKFWLFFAASLLFNFGFAVFFFLFNLYLLDFGFTERSLGMFGSLMAVGGIAGAIPVGILAERFGLSRTLSCSILMLVLFSAMRASMPWLSAQAPLAILTGLTLCSWAVCLSPAVASLTTKENRPFAFSLMFSSGIGVAGLGALAGGRLPGLLRDLPWAAPLSSIAASRATLLLACTVAMFAAWPISRLNLPSLVARPRLPRLSNPFLIRFLPAMAVWSAVTGSFAPFANVYFVHHLGLSLRSLGFVFSISQVAQFAAVLCAPLLFRWIGLTSGVMSTQLATAAALGYLATIHTGSNAAWVYWAYMGAQCMNGPGIYSLLMDRIPHGERNGASSLTFFVNSTAQAIASAATGVALVRFGYSYALMVIAGLAVVSAILFRRLSPGACGACIPEHEAEATPARSCNLAKAKM